MPDFEEATVLRFSGVVKDGGWSEWASVILDDNYGAGRVFIYSSFGGWSFSWPRGNRGKGELIPFLLKLDGDYMCGKFSEKPWQRDEQRTEEEAKRHIFSARKRGKITNAEARDELHLLEWGLDHWFYNSRTSPDGMEILREQRDPSFMHFHKKIWPEIQRAMKAYDGDIQWAKREGAA